MAKASDSDGFFIVVCIALAVWIYYLKQDLKEANQLALTSQINAEIIQTNVMALLNNTTATSCSNSYSYKYKDVRECELSEALIVAGQIYSDSHSFRDKHK